MTHAHVGEFPGYKNLLVTEPTAATTGPTVDLAGKLRLQDMANCQGCGKLYGPGFYKAYCSLTCYKRAKLLNKANTYGPMDDTVLICGLGY